MTDFRSAIDAAADWHAHLDSPDMDWEAFGVWLGTNPAHKAAYDRIALLDAEIGMAAPAIASALPANDDEPVASFWSAGGGRWRWAAAVTSGAVAAGLAVLAIPSGTWGPSGNAATDVYVTGRSETRAVTLADGSLMRIDRGSRVSVSGGGSPLIEIAQGAANFAVRHDPSRVLMVRAGGYDVRDLGTRFDVVSANGHVAVTVAEGSVSVVPTGGDPTDATTLNAGQGLDIIPAKQIAERRQIDSTRVSDWIDGRLEYDGAPLSVVAADISRYAGEPVVVDASATGVRFSGILTIGDGSRLLEQLRAVLPIRVRQVDGTVHLDAGAPH